MPKSYVLRTPLLRWLLEYLCILAVMVCVCVVFRFPRIAGPDKAVALVECITAAGGTLRHRESGMEIAFCRQAAYSDNVIRHLASDVATRRDAVGIYSVKFCGIEVTLKTIAALRLLPNLKSIGFTRCVIDDKTLEECGYSLSVVHVDLHEMRVNERALLTAAARGRWRSLDLRGTLLSTSSARELVENGNTRWLYLSVRDNAAKASIWSSASSRRLEALKIQVNSSSAARQASDDGLITVPVARENEVREDCQDWCASSS